jgi:hypothetical protein
MPEVLTRECCQHVAEDYEARLLQAAETIHGLELELRQKRSTITKLRGEQTDKDSRSQLRPHAEDVFQHWKQHISPKARVFSGKRLKVVIDRLAELPEDVEGRKQEIFEAILGAKDHAYTNPKTGVRYDDLELICRDDSYVQRFRKLHLAAQANPRLRPTAKQPVANEAKRPSAYAPPIVWVAYRIDVAGQWYVEGELQILFFPCLHHGFDGRLAWAQPIGTTSQFVRLHCTAGCEEEEIMQAYAMDGTDLVTTTRR